MSVFPRHGAGIKSPGIPPCLFMERWSLIDVFVHYGFCSRIFLSFFVGGVFFVSSIFVYLRLFSTPTEATFAIPALGKGKKGKKNPEKANGLHGS